MSKKQKQRLVFMVVTSFALGGGLIAYLLQNPPFHQALLVAAGVATLGLLASFAMAAFGRMEP